MLIGILCEAGGQASLSSPKTLAPEFKLLVPASDKTHQVINKVSEAEKEEARVRRFAGKSRQTEV